jgi:hypothetical protein
MTTMMQNHPNWVGGSYNPVQQPQMGGGFGDFFKNSPRGQMGEEAFRKSQEAYLKTPEARIPMTMQGGANQFPTRPQMGGFNMLAGGMNTMYMGNNGVISHEPPAPQQSSTPGRTMFDNGSDDRWAKHWEGHNKIQDQGRKIMEQMGPGAMAQPSTTPRIGATPVSLPQPTLAQPAPTPAPAQPTGLLGGFQSRPMQDMMRGLFGNYQQQPQQQQPLTQQRPQYQPSYAQPPAPAMPSQPYGKSPLMGYYG